MADNEHFYHCYITSHFLVFLSISGFVSLCKFLLSGITRLIFAYPEIDLRSYPGTIRVTEEWDTTYNIRTAVERDINHIKENLCLAGRRTQNKKTLHADLILAGIPQLVTVILADKIQHHEYIRSLKPLIALATSYP